MVPRRLRINNAGGGVVPARVIIKKTVAARHQERDAGRVLGWFTVDGRAVGVVLMRGALGARTRSF